jgi:hypothetical protein
MTGIDWSQIFFKKKFHDVQGPPAGFPWGILGTNDKHEMLEIGMPMLAGV